jgi:hypothetical protein
MCSELSVSVYQTMWRHIPEDSNLNLPYYLYMTWWLLAHVRGLLPLNLETSNFSWMFKFWNLSSRWIKLILKRLSFACYSEIDAKTRCETTLQSCSQYWNFYSVLGLCGCYHVHSFCLILLNFCMMVIMFVASTSFYCRSVWWLPCWRLPLHFVVGLCVDYLVLSFHFKSCVICDVVISDCTQCSVGNEDMTFRNRVVTRSFGLVWS